MRFQNLFTFILVLFFSSLFSLRSSAFETGEGRYISGLDLKNTLLQLYNINSDEVSAYEACGKIQDNTFSYSTSIEYELGFSTLLTGERITQEPDSGYILFIDKCLSSLHAFYYQSKLKNSDFISLFLPKELQVEISKTLNLPEGSDLSYVNLFLVNQDMKSKIIDSIFLKVYGSKELVPQELLENLKNDKQIFPPQEYFINGLIIIIKKAVITDAFLRY